MGCGQSEGYQLNRMSDIQGSKCGRGCGEVADSGAKSGEVAGVLRSEMRDREPCLKSASTPTAVSPNSRETHDSGAADVRQSAPKCGVPGKDAGKDGATTERPILFSGEMVRAILAGTKTQTRRIVAAGNSTVNGRLANANNDAREYFNGWRNLGVNDTRSYADGKSSGPSVACGIHLGCGQYLHAPLLNVEEGDHRWYRVRCRIEPGDRLWVRETWASPEQDKSKQGRVAYDADGACGCWIGGGEDREFICHGRVMQASGYSRCFPSGGATTLSLGKYSDIRSGEYPSYKYGWRPSIHMPRWASRITLELTDVRVERLNDISRAGAIAEGISDPRPDRCRGLDSDHFACCAEYPHRDYRARYAEVWERINGPGSWAANPWVWVLTFKRLAPAQPDPRPAEMGVR